MVAVKELMQETTSNVHVGHPLSEAHERMQEYNLEALPVLDGDEIVGLIHSRDADDPDGKPDIPKGDDMVIDHITGEVSFCYENDNVNTALATMLATGHEVLLVTNADRKLAGIITYEMIDRAGGAADTGSGEATGSRQIDTGAHAHGDTPGKPARYSSEPELREAYQDDEPGEAAEHVAEEKAAEEKEDGEDEQD